MVTEHKTFDMFSEDGYFNLNNINEQDFFLMIYNDFTVFSSTLAFINNTSNDVQLVESTLCTDTFITENKSIIPLNKKRVFSLNDKQITILLKFKNVHSNCPLNIIILDSNSNIIYADLVEITASANKNNNYQTTYSTSILLDHSELYKNNKNYTLEISLLNSNILLRKNFKIICQNTPASLYDKYTTSDIINVVL